MVSMITTPQRVPQQIPRAHEVLDTERTHTIAERNALGQFRARCA